MMWWSNTGWGVGTWMMMAVMMVIFWAVIIAVTVWVVRRGRFAVRGVDPTALGDGADRVLAERFARGEIDEAQFIRTRTVLHSTPSSDPSHQGS